MKTTNLGLRNLTTFKERQEPRGVGVLPRARKLVRLQYVQGSKKMMGLALWNVLEPKVAGYTYGPDSGVPTFSLQTLIDKEII